MKDLIALAKTTYLRYSTPGIGNGQHLAGELLKTMAAIDIELPMSCEQGVCGSCVTPVLEGVPDHRDSFLTDDEKRCGDRMMPCVSRCKGDRLVLSKPCDGCTKKLDGLGIKVFYSV